MKLYHGTNRNFDQIDLLKSKPNKDFGRGFYLAALLTERYSNMTMEEALATVFNSDTYRKVMDSRTHFYHQSPHYVFAFLEEELAKGKFE